MDRRKFFEGLVSKRWEHILYCEDIHGRKVAFKSVGEVNKCASKCFVSENEGPWKPLKELGLFEKIKEGGKNDR